jgi:hypothetical protein
MMTEAGTPTPTIAWVDGIPVLFNIYLFNKLYCKDYYVPGPNCGDIYHIPGPIVAPVEQQAAWRVGAIG